ncbi:hypothetical protein [Treponema primitia]|uniref:hypothetical protein n=1 Tax=Treponema primitia TaxID=88058 RepID=UPI00025552A9|nr:hypothetical protein [Treponema primitia]
MVDGTIIDTLNINARDLAKKWKDLIRKAPQLKQYAALDDEGIIDEGASIYPLLARTLDRGLDRAALGDFFVRMGKDKMREGFPISEVIYGVNLSEQVVIQYIMTDFVLDSTIRMYQAMGVVNNVAEFFLLGCFYLTKGFLEATYTNMKGKDSVSEELLKKYFRDDFFFKKD